jgi:DEAD/DEAH box helicase domain-containing protein
MQQDERYAEQLFARLKEWGNCAEQVKAYHRTSARSAQYVQISESIEEFLPPGVSQLYTHQYQAMQAALQGESITIATATASGKTYAMALPGRIKREQSPEATLLCVAPTRALIEQWREKIASWMPTVCVETYTGDTPQSQRAAIRSRAQALIITPDMLHMGMLPYHRNWSNFFSCLQDVIVDESHSYRGVFGSHFSLIVRRLQRVVALYRKTQPTFLFGSATIGNPDDHAAQLLGQPVSAITESGAPSGGRLTLLWQPPDDRSYLDEAAGLMAFFIAQGVRTILFGQARQSVEKMLRQVKTLIPDSLHSKVMAYRAGYTKEERRAIEQHLAHGDLYGVVSTSALEIGIDLGDLDVSIVAGFPGSISSYMQQAGRAGRRTRSALSILVLREDALDQYFSLHPEMLLDTPAERALVNSSNPYILPSHLLCAAYEAPLTPTDMTLFGPATQETVNDLVEQKKFYQRGNCYYLMDRSRSIAFHVNLRQVGQRLSIIASGKKIEDTDIHHAVTECHPGAVYYSQGSSYQVQRLNIEEGEINVFSKETLYYTEPLIETDVEILQSRQHQSRPYVELYVGDVLVTRQVEGYIKRHNQYRSVLEKCELSETLSVPLETEALWMLISDELIDELAKHHYDPAGTLHAIEHGMIALLPLFVLGDRRDVGGVSIVPYHPQTQTATIFIYDGYPGGMGYSNEAYRQWELLAKATLETLVSCDCTGGCYRCIMSPKCGSQNRPLDKAGAIFLLQALLKKKSRSEEVEE